MAERASVQLPVTIWQQNSCLQEVDFVAEEVPAALIYNGEPHAVMMVTPADLEDFARGFTLSEEIVGDPREIHSITITDLASRTGAKGFEIAITLPAERAANLVNRQRHLEGRTGCGLCGARTIEDAIRPIRRVAAGRITDINAVRVALNGMQTAQTLNLATGATHAAAWARSDGSIVAVREDVGRHNALDKLIGALAPCRMDRSDGFLLITSRASFEMVQKSAASGISLVVAVSAPTAYAVSLAQEAGITLVGFARGNRLVIYSCPARLAGPTAAEVSFRV